MNPRVSREKYFDYMCFYAENILIYTDKNCISHKAY